MPTFYVTCEGIAIELGDKKKVELVFQRISLERIRMDSLRQFLSMISSSFFFFFTSRKPSIWHSNTKPKENWVFETKKKIGSETKIGNKELQSENQFPTERKLIYYFIRNWQKKYTFSLSSEQLSHCLRGKAAITYNNSKTLEFQRLCLKCNCRASFLSSAL